MDIKLKSYSHSIVAKIIAFLLVVVSFTSMVVLSLNTLAESQVALLDNPFEENYYLSDEYANTISLAIGDLTQIARQYKSEDYIKSGNTIVEQEKEELSYKKEDLFYGFSQTAEYNDNLSREENYRIFDEGFEENYKEEIEKMKDSLIKEDLRNFHEIIARLKANSGLKYYVKQGETVFSNIENNSVNDFKKYPAYAISDKNGLDFKPKGLEELRNNIYEYNAIIENTAYVDQISIGFTDEYIGAKLAEWTSSRELIKDVLYKLLILTAVLVLSLLYLFIVTGRKYYKDQEVETSRLDKLYSDINIICIIMIISIWAIVIAEVSYRNISAVALILVSISSVMASGFVLALLLSLVRHIKNKTFFSHCLVITIVRKVYGLIKDVYDGGAIATKLAIVVIVYPLLAVGTLVFAPITIGVAVWLANKKLKEYMAIKEGVAKIKNGAIDHKIEISHDGEFKTLAEDINSIGQGFNSAISNELKSEKLKTELITNVSHDIRTPLTSIITYVDLIKREDNQSKIKEYIEIIEQKSQRLKNLTDDLFEASKASSGNIPVNFEKIDLVSLITQGLGELDTQVRESELEFKLSDLGEKIYVNADGRLLWRSIENLLTNIFKYASKGSRVYIDIIDLDGDIELSIKNISAYELNISSDELMERFKRGDESRTSEGSGLGLSISKSLIEAQGGKFDIKIDGDLFKVVIVLSKY